jgi:hypothetical protein
VVVQGGGSHSHPSVTILASQPSARTAPATLEMRFDSTAFRLSGCALSLSERSDKENLGQDQAIALAAPGRAIILIVWLSRRASHYNSYLRTRA